MNSICISSAYYPPHLGGVELFTQNLAAALSAKGIAVTVVTNGFNGEEPFEIEENGVEVFRLPASDPSGRFPVLLRTKWSQAIWRELESRAFDAIVVNTRFYPISLKMMDFAQKQGIRPILIEHGSSYLTLVGSSTIPLMPTHSVPVLLRVISGANAELHRMRPS